MSGHDRKRGRHKKRRSRETLTWEREHLIPKRPSWMPAATYSALAELRAAVGGERQGASR